MSLLKLVKKSFVTVCYGSIGLQFTVPIGRMVSEMFEVIFLHNEFNTDI